MALHYAAENGHDSVVRLLLDDGVDRNFRDGFRRIALGYAMIAMERRNRFGQDGTARYETIIRLLGGIPSTPEWYASLSISQISIS
jgi:hypothetical protein